VRIVVTIEARMRSSRLPGKVLKPILGRPMLELMIERLKRARRVNAIVVATTDHSSCDPIQDLAERVGVGCFRGSEEDVLDRVLQAARHARADLIVETTGDCPLICPSMVDHAIERFLANDVDYCSNHLDVQVFPLSVLEKVAQLTDDAVDHEHVSLYIYEKPGRFRVLDVSDTLPAGMAELRLSVDTAEDLRLIAAIFERLYPTNPAFTAQDVMDLLIREPALLDFNRQIRQKTVR
jgi:spore coat polysaccharide biosynthesis protein SpsF